MGGILLRFFHSVHSLPATHYTGDEIKIRYLDLIDLGAKDNYQPVIEIEGAWGKYFNNSFSWWSVTVSFLGSHCNIFIL